MPCAEYGRSTEKTGVRGRAAVIRNAFDWLALSTDNGPLEFCDMKLRSTLSDLHIDAGVFTWKYNLKDAPLGWLARRIQMLTIG